MTKFHQRILKIFSANAVSIEPSFLRQFCWDSDQNSFDSPNSRLSPRIYVCVQIDSSVFENFWLQKILLKVHSPKPTGSVIPQFTNRPGSPHDRPGTNIHPTGLFCSASYVTWTPCTPPSILSYRHWHPTVMKRFFTTHSYTCEFSMRAFFTVDHVPKPQLQPWMCRPRTKKTLCVR